MNIHAYFISWNEEKILPYLLRHYSQFCNKMVFFDNESDDRSIQIIKSYPNTEVRTYQSGGKLHDNIYLDIKNQCWKESRGKSDIVIVGDSDEFVYHRDIKNFLYKTRDEGYTIYRPDGFDMISVKYPTGKGQIYDEVTNGVPDDWFTANWKLPINRKMLMFNPNKISEINYSVGCHECNPAGEVKIWRNPVAQPSELLMLHFNSLDKKHLTERHRIYESRLSDWNKTYGHAVYSVEDKRIRDFEKMLAAAVPVFGGKKIAPPKPDAKKKKSGNKLVITGAKYFTDNEHSKDITKIIQTLAFDNTLDVTATNLIDGDPQPGVLKKLQINYVFNGVKKEITVSEGERIQLPDENVPYEILIATQGKSFNFPFPDFFTDIIIPVYNNDELTANCLKSIKKHTKAGTYRIIFVNNNSKELPKSMKELEGMNRICIHLPENKGFVGAVNEGLRCSDAQTVCLLNNDTLVSAKWLEKLNSALFRNNNLGIVGALTAPLPLPNPDNLKNPQDYYPKDISKYDIRKDYDSQHNVRHIEDMARKDIFPEYKNLADFNKKIEKEFPGELLDVSFVAFLCAVIKREVIDKIGFLDINFDQGLWDDLDYNRSAKKAGYESKLLMDTCIYHKGRSTFKTVEKEENLDIKKLLDKNKEYLDKKWAGNL